MSWLATPATPRPALLPSLLRLLAMSTATLAIGSAEMSVALSYVAARSLLPRQHVCIARCKHQNKEAVAEAAARRVQIIGMQESAAAAGRVHAQLAVLSPPTPMLGHKQDDAAVGSNPAQLAVLSPATRMHGTQPDTAAVESTPPQQQQHPPPPLCPSCARGLDLDHAFCRQLLRHCLHLKRLWARSLLRIYSLHFEFEDRNAGTPWAISDINPTPASTSSGISQGPYLFVHLNQSCMLESAVFPCAPAGRFPGHFLMNREFAMLPFLGWSLWLSGGVSIDRADKVQAKLGVERVVESMRREGRSYYMSIEGHRSETGALHRYKNGAALIAIRAGATIVPVISKGLREALPYGDWRVRPHSQVKMIYEQSDHAHKVHNAAKLFNSDV